MKQQNYFYCSRSFHLRNLRVYVASNYLNKALKNTVTSILFYHQYYLSMDKFKAVFQGRLVEDIQL